MSKKIEIVYEDKALVVCHKMPGIPVQTAKIGQQDMVSLLRNYFANRGDTNTQVFVVHRLDQPVEGAIVFARNKQAAAELSRQSRERSMDKCYLALAEGRFEETTGVLENYLLRDGKTNTSRVVAQGTPGAKCARLRYEVESSRTIQPDYAASLVRIQLETGRHHQIRIQMAHAGHPLIGDKKYNPNCVSGYLPVGLCATKIAFVHPVTGKDMEFIVEPQGELFRI